MTLPENIFGLLGGKLLMSIDRFSNFSMELFASSVCYVKLCLVAEITVLCISYLFLSFEYSLFDRSAMIRTQQAW